MKRSVSYLCAIYLWTCHERTKGNKYYADLPSRWTSPSPTCRQSTHTRTSLCSWYGSIIVPNFSRNWKRTNKDRMMKRPEHVSVLLCRCLLIVKYFYSGHRLLQKHKLILCCPIYYRKRDYLPHPVQHQWWLHIWYEAGTPAAISCSEHPSTSLVNSVRMNVVKMKN